MGFPVGISTGIPMRFPMGVPTRIPMGFFMGVPVERTYTNNKYRIEPSLLSPYKAGSVYVSTWLKSVICRSAGSPRMGLFDPSARWNRGPVAGKSPRHRPVARQWNSPWEFPLDFPR
jgi:hypothetical protein